MRLYQVLCDDCGPIGKPTKHRGNAHSVLKRHNCETWLAGPVRIVRDRDSAGAQLMAIANKAVNRYLREHPQHAADADAVLSDACLGVTRAMASYDAVKAGEKSTIEGYAFQRAMWAIQDGVRGRGHLSRRDYRRMLEARQAGGDVSERLRVAVSLDYEDDSGGSLGAILSDPHGEDPYRAIEAAATIAALLPVLNRRQRYVVEQTFLHDRTLADVAAELNITESAVCICRNRALSKLRERAAA